jgi:hypothetical protein
MFERRRAACGKPAYEQSAALENKQREIALAIGDVEAEDRRDEVITLSHHCDRGKDCRLPEAPVQCDQNDREKVEGADGCQIQMQQECAAGKDRQSQYAEH